LIFNMKNKQQQTNQLENTLTEIFKNTY